MKKEDLKKYIRRMPRPVEESTVRLRQVFRKFKAITTPTPILDSRSNEILTNVIRHLPCIQLPVGLDVHRSTGVSDDGLDMWESIKGTSQLGKT